MVVCTNFIEKSNQCELVIFDLDGTIHSHKDIYDTDAVLKKDIYDIFECLKKNNIKIALVSLNSVATKYLKRYNIFDYFDYIEYKNWKVHGDSKIDLFDFIQKKSNISYENMLFFDDREYHCIEATNLKIKSTIVNREDLLTWNDISDGFSLFNQILKRHDNISTFISTNTQTFLPEYKNTKKRNIQLIT